MLASSQLPDHRDHYTEHGEPVGSLDAVSPMPRIRRLRLQNGDTALDPQSLDRRSIAGKEGHDDIALLGHERTIDQHAVAIEDAGAIHRIAGDSVEHRRFGISNQPFLKIAALFGKLVNGIWSARREAPRESGNSAMR